ncbi:MAG: hypothetical protein WCL51_14905 [Bacteroidota bacterium]
MKTVLFILKSLLKKTFFFQVIVVVGLLFNPLFSKSQQPFTAGSIVTLRTGDGVAALSTASAALFLDEYTTSGQLIQSIAIPTTGTNKLVNSGSATSEGILSLSQDKLYLTLAGYDATSGVTGIVATTAAATNRKLLRIDNALNIVPVTSATAFSGNNIRSGVFYNNNYWAAGTGSTAGTNGVQYFGTGTPVQVSSTVTNVRSINIFNNQLYFSTGSGTVGIYSVGTGMPTITAQTSTSIIASTGTSPSPYGFAINATGDVCYVADDRSTANGGGIIKYTKTGGVWSLAYTMACGNSVGSRNLTVDWSGAHPIIYATTSEATSATNRIISIVDNGSAATATLTTLVTSSAITKVFRGIAFSPITSSTAPIVSTGTSSNINMTTATCAGNVSSDGGAAISKRGICYSTSANPDTNSSKVIVAGTTGTFTANLTNLNSGTTYHYRAFALNAVGITYGTDLTFQTNPYFNIGSVIRVETNGDTQYWDGTTWITVAPGLPGQSLQFVNGVPSWIW